MIGRGALTLHSASNASESSPSRGSMISQDAHKTKGEYKTSAATDRGAKIPLISYRFAADIASYESGSALPMSAPCAINSLFCSQDANDGVVNPTEGSV